MVTSSAVVGSSAMSSFGSHDQRHGDHDALAQPARELVGILVEPLGRTGHVDQGQDFERTLPGLCLGHVAVQQDAFGDLLADGHGGIERRHRVLGDERHLVPPDLAHLLLVERGQVPAEQRDAPADHMPVVRQQPHDGQAGGALAAAGLPDDPDALALTHVEGDVVDRHHGRVAHAELGPEVLHFQHGGHPPTLAAAVGLATMPAQLTRRFHRGCPIAVPGEGAHVGPAPAVDGRQAVAPQGHLVHG